MEKKEEVLIEIEQDVESTKMRFSGAHWFKAGPQDIIIGGVGGIGSWLAFFLGRIGHNLYLFDGDLIEDVNLAGQFYNKDQIGKLKVTAVQENIKSFCSLDVSIDTWYTSDSMTNPIVFSAFDNMKARKLMFEKWAEQEDREIFIDGRLLMEGGQVFCVLKGQEEAYRAELFDDDEVQDLPCNYKATSHCGAFIGSLMTSIFNNYLANKVQGFEISTVQFKTEFILPLVFVEGSDVPVITPEMEIVEEVKVLEND